MNPSITMIMFKDHHKRKLGASSIQLLNITGYLGPLLTLLPEYADPFGLDLAGAGAKLRKKPS